MSPSFPLPRHLLPVTLVSAAHAVVLFGLWARSAATPVTAPQIMDVMVVSEQVAPTPVPPEPSRTPPPRRPVPRPPNPVPEPLPKPAPAPAPAEPTLPVAPPPTAAAPVDAPVVTTPPRVDASYRGNVAPPYPMASRRLREEGTVVLRIFVNADGTVGEVQLGKSSGYSRLDQAAMDTVKRWKLIPARRGSEPFATWYSLPLTFKLEN